MNDRTIRACVITNNHVVMGAPSVSVSFEKEDGSSLSYGNCKVIWFDRDLDLAIIDLPEKEAFQLRGLQIETTRQNDGAEVWSAGFPTLMGRPSWQFARGNITNKNAKVPEIIDPALSVLIQHSAPIDPGNSGGPLLVKNARAIGGYKIIGINTWSVRGRDNVYFALPASHLTAILDKAVIARYSAGDAALRKKALKSACIEFAAEMRSERTEYARIKHELSDKLVGETGWDSFMTLMKTSSGKDRDRLQDEFFYYSPVETMRKSIFRHLWEITRVEGNASDITFSQLNISDEKDFDKLENVRTVFLLDGREKEIVWSFSAGRWQIVAVSMQQVKTAYGNTTPIKPEETQNDTPRKINIWLAYSVYSLIDRWRSGISTTPNVPLQKSRIEAGVTIPIIAIFSIASGLVWAPYDGYSWDFVNSEGLYYTLYFLEIPLLL